ncbi:MAG: Crp/Fnr family transcriptional regulator [Daejeonella sp.]|uniref:Crp/Fnr family transcriptional regulator n=1 Tax=Daejeonella sp. TaxID=2805397 RepID=UPI002736A5B5|nr:Crp/Fnr family transcriptional regulator [Daejeonella sp.]MDP3468637.1 Crp/Fnr family transcriptional regulator [Daejeonella sp.]
MTGNRQQTTENSLSQLKLLSDQIHKLNQEEWEAFSSIWTPFTAKRKEIITRSGERERYLYFVLEGVQRVYYHDEYGREATLVFTYSPSFGGVLDSMLNEQVSKYNYETLSRSEFLRVSFSDLKDLMFRYQGVRSIIMTGVSGALAGVLERLAELQCFSSEEKFKKLMSRSPHILNIVPHKYLANYLGIDPSNFSKLINRVII